jgi:hypothetical protein
MGSVGSSLVRCVAGVIAVLVASAHARASLLDANPLSPNYNNPSFETPDVAEGPTSVSLDAPPWTLTGPRIMFDLGPPIGPVPINPGTGVFDNPSTTGNIANAHGEQLAYIFANSYASAVPGDPSDHSFTQVLATTFEAGQAYSLTIGIASAQAAPPADSVLTMSLFAFDSSNPSNELLLASNEIDVSEINGLTLTDFTAGTAPISGAAIGKQIGIRISTHTELKLPSATGQFSFDNVRLVPEPGSAVLLGGAAISLFGARKRRR